MTAEGSFRCAILMVAALGACGGVALAQTPAPPPAAAAPTTTANATSPDPGVHDRVLALVQARKCGPAHDEAVSGGDDLLAQQVSDLCGLRPTRDAGAKGGGRRGGGQKPPGR